MRTSLGTNVKILPPVLGAALSAVALLMALSACRSPDESASSERSPGNEASETATSGSPSQPGTPPCPTPTSVGSGDHHIGLVVTFSETESVARCVALDDPQPTAFEVIKASELEVVSEYNVTFDGYTLCRLSTDEGWTAGCTAPSEACFCDPEGAFWAFWRLNEGSWQKSQVGLASATLASGDVLAQHWSAVVGSPPACSYDEICAAS